MFPNYSHLSVNLDAKYAGTNYSEQNKFGYFQFKPEVILEVLSDLSDGDILIYIDANDIPLIGLDEYIYGQLNNNKYDIIVSSTNYLQRRMRHELGRLFFSPMFYFYSGFFVQPEAGCIAIRKTDYSILKVQKWYQYTRAIAYLNELKKDNKSRHDQEALTYVLLQTNFNKAESWFGNKFTNRPNLRQFIIFEGNRD